MDDYELQRKEIQLFSPNKSNNYPCVFFKERIENLEVRKNLEC